MESPYVELIIAVVSAALGWFAKHFGGGRS